MARERSYHEMSTGITPTCREPNPADPAETCTLRAHDEGDDHSWQYCTAVACAGGSWTSCERERGHDGRHRAEWDAD